MKKLIDEYPSDIIPFPFTLIKNDHIKPKYDNIFRKTSGNIFTVSYDNIYKEENLIFDELLYNELLELKDYKLIYTGTCFNQKIIDCIKKNKLPIEIVAYLLSQKSQLKIQKNVDTFIEIEYSIFNQMQKLFPNSSFIQIISGHLPIYLEFTKFISEDSMPRIEQCHYPYKIGPLNWCLFDNSNDYNVYFHAIDTITNCIPNLYKWSPRLFSFLLNFSEQNGFRNHIQKVFDFSNSSIYKYDVETFKTHACIGKIFTSPMQNFYGIYHNNHFNDCRDTYGVP